MYTGHPSLRSQFFKKWNVFYVRRETFNISVNHLYHHAVVEDKGFPGKKTRVIAEGLYREAMKGKLSKLSMIGHARLHAVLSQSEVDLLLALVGRN